MGWGQRQGGRAGMRRKGEQPSHCSPLLSRATLMARPLASATMLGPISQCAGPAGCINVCPCLRHLDNQSSHLPCLLPAGSAALRQRVPFPAPPGQRGGLGPGGRQQQRHAYFSCPGGRARAPAVASQGHGALGMRRWRLLLLSCVAQLCAAALLRMPAHTSRSARSP